MAFNYDEHSPPWISDLKKKRSPSYRIHFCRFSSNKQYAKIAISGIALQFELWYCKNDLNGLLIFNFNFKTILTCLLFFKVVKVNCEWRLIKQKPYINQPNFVIILGNEKCDTFSGLLKHVNFRLLIVGTNNILRCSPQTFLLLSESGGKHGNNGRSFFFWLAQIKKKNFQIRWSNDM